MKQTANLKNVAESTELFKKVTALIFDVDGVLTDGGIIVLPSGLFGAGKDGEVVRRMNIRDGFALQYAVKKGYNIAVITGGRSETIKRRLNNLGVSDVFMGIENKIDCFRSYVKEKKTDPMNILFMGDDLPDIEVMRVVGIPACPLDASEEIKVVSKYISDKNGGAGCVRDVLERTMKAQGKWTAGEREFEW